MARGDERHSRVSVSRHGGSDIEPFGIYRHGDQSCTGRTKEVMRPRISGILHPDRSSRPKEDARRKIEALLRAADENHLIGRTGEPSSISQIGREELS
jgi:hypothetical protein